MSNEWWKLSEEWWVITKKKNPNSPWMIVCGIYVSCWTSIIENSQKIKTIKKKKNSNLTTCGLKLDTLLTWNLIEI